MPKQIDVIGQVFGYLTAINNTNEKSKFGLFIWEFKCKCGNIIKRPLSHVLSGNTKSCGCLQKEKVSKTLLKDLTNKKFGKLLVLKQVESYDKYPRWECLCDCGNIKIYKGDVLRSGNNKSCGCSANENKIVDIIGKKFGYLTVISEKIKNKPNEVHKWKCLCDCGNYCYSAGGNLRAGHKISCGCVNSIGEANIEKILNENNISFEKQFYFKDLKDKRCLKFDFAIFHNNILSHLIEFQGKQHFEKIGWKQVDNDFEDRVKKDNMKKEYCKSKNIPLIEIIYNQEFTIKDLLLNENKKE